MPTKSKEAESNSAYAQLFVFQSFPTPSLLLPPLPPDNSRAERPGEQAGVIGADHALDALGVKELQIANDSGEDGLQLHVCELLADATMSASAERQVWGCGALADKTIAVVLGLLGNALLDVLGCQADVLVGRVLVPAVRLPLHWFGEVLGDTAGDTGRGEEDVRCRDDPVGSLDGQRVLDHAHDAVNRSVDAKSLLDDLSVQGEAAEVLVVEVLDRAVGVQAKNLLLLLKQILLDVGPRSKTEQNPADGGGRAVLASHEKSDHHVGDLAIGNSLAVLVFTVHQVPDHILFSVSGGRVARRAPFFNDISVHLCHLLLRSVTSAVVRQRQPAQLEVDRDETTVEIVVQLGEACIETFADFPALERARSSVDGQFSKSGWEVDGAVVGSEALRGCILGEESLGLGSDEFDVGAEGGGGEAVFDELHCVSRRIKSPDPAFAHLLLLHELGVRAVVNDILAKDRCGKRVVDFLGVDVLQLAIENEVIAFGAQADGGLLAQQNESEDITVLLAAGKEEGIGVHAIGDGVANPWQEVKDERRLVGVAEEDLLGDVQEDDEDEQTTGSAQDDEPGG
jgi:hypothetical protein